MSRLAVPVLLLAALVLAGCAPADTTDAATSTGASSTTTADACPAGALPTRTPDTLTLATDQPAYEPWFVDDTPENGQGYEGAVAAAVAEQLGYSDATTTWVRVPFNAAIAPGPKTFDVDINQFSITDERKQAVDFSSPYYDVTQAVIAVQGTPAADATSLSALQDVKLGAQVGTTSYSAITDVIEPSSDPAVFNNNDDAKAALSNGQVGALVVDLPTAFYITSAELDNGVIVGQLPQGSGTPEQFGMVLDQGSELTSCVSAAVDALRADGTLDRLATQWLAETGGARTLS